MKILIVDDSKAMRMIVTRTLRQAGYDGAEIVEAANGIEGLAAIDAHSPDLVLSDWNMPELNGIEFLRALRARGDSRAFGFVTSEGSDDMRELARKGGAEFLLAKPFTPETMRDALAAAFVA